MFVSFNGVLRWMERALTSDYRGSAVSVSVYGALSVVNGEINGKQNPGEVSEKFYITLPVGKNRKHRDALQDRMIIRSEAHRYRRSCHVFAKETRHMCKVQV